MPIQAYKTSFQYGDSPTAAASNTWTPFAQVIEIKPPKIEAKDVDTTTLDAEEGFETFEPSSFANGGEAELKVQFEKSQQVTFYSLFRVIKGYRIQFNDSPTVGNGSKLAFDGYIKSIQSEVQKRDLVECTVMVKISGKPLFTPAT